MVKQIREKIDNENILILLKFLHGEDRQKLGDPYFFFKKLKGRGQKG